MFGAYVPLFIGGLGPPELILIFLIVALLFGADRIPKLARSTGQAMSEFERGKAEAQTELEEMREELDEETETNSNTNSDV